MTIRPQPYATSKGTRWKVRFRVPGKNNPTSESFDSADAAGKFIRLMERVGPVAAQAARHASDTSDTDVPTLATYFERHLSRLEASATPGTVADYRRLGERTWLKQLGAFPVDAINRDAVIRWVAWQRQQETVRSRVAREKATEALRRGKVVTIPEPITYSAKSISNAQRLLSTVLQAAVDDQIIQRNPARGVALPTDKAGEEMTFLSENEFALLLDAMAEHYRPFVAFLAGTGARWGEATALAPEDFDLDARKPVVRISRAWKKGAAGVYLGTTKTRRGVRTVALGRSLVDLIRPVVEATAPGELVFAAAEGGRIRAQNFHPRVWHKAVAASGIPKRPRVHDLRHSHASWLISAGIPLTVVQRRLGHESIQTTSDTYGHLSPDADFGAAEAAEIALSGALPQIEA